MPQQTAGRILSIQSHVTFGYVGGKAAVFPLQCLGYDVDVVNTVNFSNHSGYGRFGGARATAAELAKLFELMEQNGLLLCERLLTGRHMIYWWMSRYAHSIVGYVPGAEALAAVKDLASKMKQKNPELIYLLDPVLGDAGRLYVSPECIPIYREALQYSSVITPNWFEVEVLTDTRITDLASLRKALRVLHEDYHVPNVVISSIPLKAWLRAALPPAAQPTDTDSTDADFLACISSSTDAASTSTVHARCVPCLPGYFSGVGDLFSALVLGHFQPAPSVPSSASAEAGAEQETPLAHAVAHALSKTHALLTLTHEHAAGLPEADRLPTDEELDAREPERKVRRMRGRELRLIQGQDVLRGAAGTEYFRMVPWGGFWDEP
ncbi:Ribokinase-like protein [Fomitopsis serialis]|uniref:Ribokinase-like protein n=1 Tax=Fomitopsis serialis TaxID=139415 RepID=UPI002008E3F1|nr:Ribokinase-like protein [Neoantrodia serialis]KAH9930244.1 Ribokinase-like protein [Neoantrodia serialis]